MQDWMNKYFLVVFPFFFVGIWLFSTYWVAVTSGWRLLAKRFRMQGDYSGQKWKMQSARMRWLTGYNGCLTIAADNAGLFIVPFVLFRVWHPALFIPWTEITARGKTVFFLFNMIELRLGRSEEIPFVINANLAAKIEAAAGSSWPAGYTKATESAPPPIA